MSDGLTADSARGEGVALDAPALLRADPAALEFLRAWVSGEQVAVQLREDLWVDPAAWGVALVDVAVAAARSYGRRGLHVEVALERIREGMDAEFDVAQRRQSPSPNGGH
jgi:hypothetical protein